MSRNINLVISFVRHAESCGNVGIPYLQDYQKDDPPLSPAGLLQAEWLADSGFLSDADRIFSSTLVRAVETAYPTAEKLKKPIILLSDLMENELIAPEDAGYIEADQYYDDCCCGDCDCCCCDDEDAEDEDVDEFAANMAMFAAAIHDIFGDGVSIHISVE